MPLFQQTFSSCCHYHHRPRTAVARLDDYSLPNLRKQVESTHATPSSENERPDEQQQTAETGAGGNQSHNVRSGSNGNVEAGAGASGGGVARGSEMHGQGDGVTEKKAAKVPSQRRKSTSLDTGRKAAQQRAVGYPMAAVSAVLRQLHMRVLSGDEMTMLDKVCFVVSYCVRLCVEDLDIECVFVCATWEC